MVELDTGTDELLCHIEDRVGVITLNKPHKKNALGDVLTPALRRALVTLDEDSRVGCIMITGAGDAFCAGGDVGGMGASGGDKPAPKKRADAQAELVHKQATLTLRIHELSKVSVAALPGAAAGAGLSIALACDLRVAADSAFITTAFRNIGLSGDYGASWFLPRLVGLAKAKELFYASERVAADECLRLGIVNKVYPRASFRQDALAFAAHLAQGPTRALARMKVNLNAGMDQSLRDSLVLEAAHLMDSMQDPEAKEAIGAFMEKRQPQFHPPD